MLKTKWKRIFALTMAMIMGLSLTACGGGSNDTSSANQVEEDAGGTTEAAAVGEEADEQAIEPEAVDETRKTTANSEERYESMAIGIDNDPLDLLPYNVNNGIKPYIYYSFYETLFDFEDGEYIPVMVKDYEVVDELHYKVELFDYIYDSAGNNITADDIIFSYDVLLDSGYAVKYDIFDHIEKIDDYTIEFVWTKEVDGVGELEWPWCRTMIFSQEAYENGNFATQPVATGPYVVSSFTSGSEVVLEANDDYWQTDKSLITKRHEANVQTIRFDIITESSQHVIALQTRDISFSDKIPVENIEEFQASDEYSVYTTQGALVYCLNINQLERKPGNDENFRKAVYYAIDNDACVTATGDVTLPAKAFGTAFFADYEESWEDNETYENTFNPDLAKEYLEKSSYDGETIVLMGYNSEVFKNIMTMVQSFLVNIGIDVEIQAVDSTIADNSVNTEEDAYDILLHTIGGGSQIGQWNRVLNNTEFANGMSHSFLYDETLQEMFMEANKAETHTSENMTALQEYIIENAYEYAVATAKLAMVYDDSIAEVYLRENQYFMPGAFTYYLD